MAKILIVDDDVRCAQTVAQHLTALGHRCAIRQNGNEVMPFLQKQVPDLLILDVMLPGISGFQVCRTIRQDETLYHLPIMVLSAMANPEEIEHGLQQGADDYVTKPFQMDTLITRVNAILQSISDDRGFQDAATGLANARGTKRELQHRVQVLGPIGLAYIELMGLNTITDVGGQEARDKVLRHLARALQGCGQTFKPEQFFVGHMGAGHFLCIVPENMVKPYCERVREAWYSHRDELIDAVPGARQRADALAATGTVRRVLGLLFSVTKREEGEATSAHELLEVLSRIHNVHSGTTKSGIYLDRRAHSGDER